MMSKPKTFIDALREIALEANQTISIPDDVDSIHFSYGSDAITLINRSGAPVFQMQDGVLIRKMMEKCMPPVKTQDSGNGTFIHTFGSKAKNDNS